MNLKRFAIIGLVLAVFAAPAQAVVLTYESELDYNAAVGSQLYFLNFDGLEPGMAAGNFAGMVDFGSPDASDASQVFFASEAMTDDGYILAANLNGPVNGIFDGPVFAFGLEFQNAESPQSMDIYNASDVLIGQYDMLGPEGDGFLGVLSDEEIASFVVYNNLGDRFFVDDFRANALADPNPNPNPIPEPGTMLLLGSGLAGLGAAVRRRRK